MTAEEKAKNIYDRYKDYFDYDFMDRPLNDYMATEYSLICVDVILNDVGAKDWELDTGTNTNYWQEVKQEINKL
jgi:hypothetical protein